MNHTLMYALTATTLSAALATPFLAVLWRLRQPGANAKTLLRAGMLGGVAGGVGCMVGASIVVLRTYEPELWQLFLLLPVIGLLFGACVAGALVAAYLTKKHRGSTKAVSIATTLWIAAIISPALFLRPSDIHGVRGTVYVGGPSESGAGRWHREAGVLVFVDRATATASASCSTPRARWTSACRSTIGRTRAC